MLGKNLESLLNIVDLAGSERQERVANGGDRSVSAERKPNKSGPEKKPAVTKRPHSSAKYQSANASRTKEGAPFDQKTEAKFINQSLTTLGRIFSILSNRKLQGTNAPPYRESKLTRILQSSLRYDSCKCLMIVNICSEASNSQQTKESLEFASKAMIAF